MNGKWLLPGILALVAAGMIQAQTQTAAELNARLTINSDKI